MAGTSEIYTQTWPGKGGGSRDGFHLAVNKHASHLGTQGCQSSDPPYPFSKGQAEWGWGWPCLGARKGSFHGVPLPKGGGDFLRMEKAEVGMKKRKFQGVLLPEKAEGMETGSSVCKVTEQQRLGNAMFLTLPVPDARMGEFQMPWGHLLYNLFVPGNKCPLSWPWATKGGHHAIFAHLTCTPTLTFR